MIEGFHHIENIDSPEDIRDQVFENFLDKVGQEYGDPEKFEVAKKELRGSFRGIKGAPYAVGKDVNWLIREVVGDSESYDIDEDLRRILITVSVGDFIKKVEALKNGTEAKILEFKNRKIEE